MKLSSVNSRVIRFDIVNSNQGELDVEIACDVEVNDYLNDGHITLVINWKVNAIDKSTNEEIIGYLHQTTAIVLDSTFDQDDLLLLKRLVEAAFLHAERLFQDQFVFQRKLPTPQFYPIAADLLDLIATHLS